jgi:uncharacterized damage-inducible protein DinB
MHTQELLIETTPYIPPARALESLAIEDAERRLPSTNHSIAEIVAHMNFWQDWFCRRCTGIAEPIVAKAAHGWPSVARGTWPEVQAKFLGGLERAAALGKPEAALLKLVVPAIEFPPLARYTVGDAVVHICNHNAYHLGQVILLRQLLGLWPPPSGGWTW